MGKRVNLAELATDELYEPSVPRPPLSTTPVPDEANDVPGLMMRSVPVNTVVLNPLNKRRPGGDEELATLADTMRAHGVIQPLVVCSTVAYLAEFPAQRPSLQGAHWVVLIGNRRLQAAQIADLDEITVIVNDDQVTSMYEAMLIENGQRRELPPLLEAEAISEVLKVDSISQRELARRIGKSPMYVTQRLALLKLSPALRAALEQGDLTIERAREFGELSIPEQQEIVAAGKPYRRPSVNARRAGWASSPTRAASAIQEKFSRQELGELVQLLTTHLDSLDPDER